MDRGRIDDGGDRGGTPRLDGEADGRAVLAVESNPREMATAFTAWFTEPAPTA